MLERNGIKTALDLRDANNEWNRQRMTVVGARIVQELRGVQCIPFIQTPKVKQQLCVSRSFGAATDDLQDLRQIQGCPAICCQPLTNRRPEE